MRILYDLFVCLFVCQARNYLRSAEKSLVQEKMLLGISTKKYK